MAKVEKVRSRLGRGLSSLMSGSDAPAAHLDSPVMIELPAPAAAPKGVSDTAPPSTAAAGTMSGGRIEQLALGSIVPNPHQPRRTISEASVADLAASLKSTGLIQPILVRQVAQGYQLIAGERRWRAAKVAGFETLPAIVKDADSATQAQMALVENIQREDLNPIDRAQSYRSLMDQLGLTQAELADRLGEQRSGIANYVRLLNLAEPVREKVRSGELSLGHAKLLAGIDDLLEQQRLADLILSRDLSVRNLERVIASPTDDVEARTVKVPTPHVQDLERSLSRQLGMRVQVRSGGKTGSGRLVLYYTSLDQFDELLTRMAVKTEP